MEVDEGGGGGVKHPRNFSREQAESGEIAN